MIYEEDLTTSEDMFADEILDARTRCEDDCSSEFRACTSLEIMFCDSEGHWDEDLHGEKIYYCDPDTMTQGDWDELFADLRKTAERDGLKYVTACVRFDDYDEASVREYQAECEEDDSWNDPDEWVDNVDEYWPVYSEPEMVFVI